jgi:hypothetical protein
LTKTLSRQSTLKGSGLPFIFKGGTSLMLLTSVPRRFSTDIDIIVAQDTPLENYLEKAAEFWPFIRFEEQHLKTKSGIEKRHFKFIYHSPTKMSEFYILLDVVFEESHYATLIEKNISNDLLLTSEPYVSVYIPNANCLLGDKLTAFAPTTTGIPFNIEKELEIIKQLYDIASLVPMIDNFDEVKRTYSAVVESELLYRGLDITAQEVMMDTLRTAVCLADKGRIKSLEFDLLSKGIKNIRNHILFENFTHDTAMKCACIALYVTVSLLTDRDELPIIKPLDHYNSCTIVHPEYNRLNYIRKLDMHAYAYAYAYEAVSLLT